MEYTMNGFRPMLLPNEQPDLNKIVYPLLASFKLDGIRAVFMDGELYSRSLKVLPNSNLHTKFAHLKEYSKKNNVILDGELYCQSIPFNELSGIIRSDDQTLPYDLEFWCFDYLTVQGKHFADRVKDYEWLRLEALHPVAQVSLSCASDVSRAFDHAIANGFEGLVLKSPSSFYKFGRATLASNTAFKVKPFVTYDAKIVGITQATEAREGSEKKINELGRSVTSKKIADRVLINKAAGFIVVYKGKELEVGLAKHDNAQKEHIWSNPQEYIGRMIEYKCLEVGMNEGGLPRHANFVRYRDDKDAD